MADIRPGSTFAGYEVLRMLGQGGMGQVFLVRNPQLDRQEALKVISAGTGDNDFAERFTNEARTAAALDHAGIVTIYHYGIDGDTPWFTMTYLQGSDLNGAAPMPPADVATVVTRAAEALDYAHQRGVIHRDIKPANLQVARDERGRISRVTVLDFGIARLVNASGMTAMNTFIGTLSYGAPEALAGSPAAGASDQYALACTAYELLTGAPPFTSKTPSALMSAHLNSPPPHIGRVKPALASLDPVFQRALAKNPAQRFRDCTEFARALSESIAHPGRPSGPVGAVPPTAHIPAQPRPVLPPPPPPGPPAPPMGPPTVIGPPPFPGPHSGGVPPSGPLPPSGPIPPSGPVFQGAPLAPSGPVPGPVVTVEPQQRSSNGALIATIAIVCVVALLGVVGFFVINSLRDDDNSSPDTVAGPANNDGSAGGSDPTDASGYSTYDDYGSSGNTYGSTSPQGGTVWGMVISPEGSLYKFGGYSTPDALLAAAESRYSFDRSTWGHVYFTDGCGAFAAPYSRTTAYSYAYGVGSSRSAAESAAIDSSENLNRGATSQSVDSLCVGDTI